MSLPSPEWRQFGRVDEATAAYIDRCRQPIEAAEIHAAELAALRDEVDQQRTRAEAAEAELRTAREVIATMEEAQTRAEQDFDAVFAANNKLCERISAARAAIVKLRMSCADLGISEADYQRMRADCNRICDLLAGRTVQ